MSLQEEINARASKIYRESYQMSIGELINLYRDGEIPNFNVYLDGMNIKKQN